MFVILFYFADDGQPENIGYGYQKSLTPNRPTAGVFEDIPLLENELGSHDTGVDSITYADKKELEDIVLDYIAGNMGHSNAAKHKVFQYGNHNAKKKKSVFRERDINISPDTLQNLFPDQMNSNQYFENGEHAQNMPSPFRERTSQKPSRHSPARNAQALVKSFGGLNRDTDEFPGNSDDSDEYLSMLNSVWEKYQNSNPDHFDPEDLSESDFEEIMGLLSPKEEIKKGGKYENNDDFFNSPLAWVKRDRQMSHNGKSASNQYLHALNLLNTHTNTFEPMPEEETPNEENDVDVGKLLLDDYLKGSTNKKLYIKRFWRGNTNREYKMAKRFPVTKRSLSFYTSPAVLYHEHSGLDKYTQRRKKNIKSHISEAVTDPKVAQELNFIFSATENMSKDSPKFHNNTNKTLLDRQGSYNSTNATEPHSSFTGKQNASKDFAIINSDHGRFGQKEEPSVDSQHKQLDISKKSVDWSDYFGIDKRHKKSKPEDDGWLLDQYLKAYSISAKAMKNSEDESKPGYSRFEIDKKSSDDIDAKLRAMEDMIVDQTVKYTGAHEGMTDSEEIQAVKDRVIDQLAAAYSLEKMRKALKEFKTSMAAQKSSEPTHTATNTPNNGRFNFNSCTLYSY